MLYYKAVNIFKSTFSSIWQSLEAVVGSSGLILRQDLRRQSAKDTMKHSQSQSVTCGALRERYVHAIHVTLSLKMKFTQTGDR